MNEVNQIVRPQHNKLDHLVDYYWIIEDAHSFFQGKRIIHEFPGVTPEAIIVLEGSYDIYYKGTKETVYSDRMYAFIEEGVVLDLSALKSFIIIQFKPACLASVLPFISEDARTLFKKPICLFSEVFDEYTDQKRKLLRVISSDLKIQLLEEVLLSSIKSENQGFLSEICDLPLEALKPKSLRERTNYSVSSLERYFKKETGLTPGKYFSIRRYNEAMREIFQSTNMDWMHYVAKYDFYDQSHFIKEMKKYTRITPTKLLKVDGLASFRQSSSFF